jgi:hypothetical protein
MTVKLIKLINGDELLAEITTSTDILKIKNPVRIVVMPNKIDPKTPNIGFAPWADFSDDKSFTLDMSHVLCIMTPIKEFASQYSAMFGKIVTPQSGLILRGT